MFTIDFFFFLFRCALPERTTFTDILQRCTRSCARPSEHFENTVQSQTLLFHFLQDVGASHCILFFVVVLRLGTHKKNLEQLRVLISDAGALQQRIEALRHDSEVEMAKVAPIEHRLGDVRRQRDVKASETNHFNDKCNKFVNLLKNDNSRLNGISKEIRDYNEQVRIIFDASRVF